MPMKILAVRQPGRSESPGPPRDRWDVAVQIAKAIGAVAVMITTLLRLLLW
jgi:hypothetical protein